LNNCIDRGIIEKFKIVKFGKVSSITNIFRLKRYPAPYNLTEKSTFSDTAHDTDSNFVDAIYELMYLKISCAPNQKIDRETFFQSFKTDTKRKYLSRVVLRLKTAGKIVHDPKTDEFSIGKDVKSFITEEEEETEMTYDTTEKFRNNEMPINYQVFKMVVDSGEEGIRTTEIKEKLGLRRLDIIISDVIKDFKLKVKHCTLQGISYRLFVADDYQQYLERYTQEEGLPISSEIKNRMHTVIQFLSKLDKFKVLTNNSAKEALHIYDSKDYKKVLNELLDAHKIQLFKIPKRKKK